RQEAQNFSINFTEEELFASLKEGATVNGNYVLNYTNEISNKIKQLCRRKANDITSNMRAELAKRSDDERNPLLIEKEQLKTLRKSSLEQTNLQATLDTQLQLIED